MIIVRRAWGVGGTIRLWVCPVATGRNGAPLACTAKLSLRSSLRVAVPATMTGRLRLVVVGARPPRRRH